MNAKIEALMAVRHAEVEQRHSPDGLFALLREAAAEVPDATLCYFIDSDDTLTYAEFLESVTKLATGLARLGVERGVKVGVMLDNVPAFPLTWLALAALGATMVPLNTRYTPREIVYALENSEATFLVIDERFLPLFREAHKDLAKLPPRGVIVHGADHGDFGATFAEISASPADEASWTTRGNRDDLVNIQYTSGTTGFPKGCMLTQDYWLVMSAAAAWRDGRCFKRILCTTPFFYLDPQWQFSMALQSRGTIFVCPRLSGSRLMEWIRTYRIEFCLFLSDAILKQPPSPSDRDHSLIRVNINGLPKGNHRPLEERFGIVARESYGMTEIGTTIYMPMEAAHMVGSGACGLPAPFRQCRIVDESGVDVVRGETGELVVHGRGLMLGYYRNPEATKSAILDGKWVRTGDLFRQDEDGYYYIVGRKKDMIRRAGENIAAREVEAVIKELDGILDAAVVPVPDDIRGEEVKLYAVLASGQTPQTLSPQEIVDHCMGRLAAFKVPRYIEYVDRLPKTPSDRVEKHKIREMLAGRKTQAWDRAVSAWVGQRGDEAGSMP